MEKKKNRMVWVIWLVIMAAGTALMFCGITKESLWYDESYTAAIVNHSFSDIITISGADSHPPLYYLGLRLFCMLFGHSVLALRAFSALGIISLAALGIGPVRRALGNRVGLIFAFITFILPISLAMAHETRMYTWAAFFVTASMLFGYLAYRENNVKDWIIFGGGSLCAAYTHYYALLAEVMLFFILFVMMLIAKKKLKLFLITSGAMILGYLPWLFKLAGQYGRVSKSYWIPKVTETVIKNTLVYPFSSKFSIPWSPTFVNAAFYVSVALTLIVIAVQCIKKDAKSKAAILAVGVYALTIGAGIAASYIIRPVLVERYMMPVLGLFILGLAYGIGNLGKKVLPMVGCAVILAFSVPQTQFALTHRFNGPMTEAVEYIQPQIQHDDVFLHTDEHTLGTFCYYFQKNTHYYYQKEGTGGYSNYDAFLPIGIMIESPDAIETTGRIWLVQRNGAADSSSVGQWLSSKYFILNGTAKRFAVDMSWYSFIVYPGNFGE